MNPGLAAVAVAVVAGGIIAVSSRESRVAVLGLTLAGVGAPLIADPTPGPLGLAVRVVASLLSGYLLWVALRAGPSTAGSPLGWPVEALVAGAAGIAGYGAIRIVAGGAGVGGEAAPALIVELGPREALAAGTALAALSLGPMLLARDVLRLGMGLAVGVLAAGLVRVGLAGSAEPLEHIAMAGLGLAVAAGTAMIAMEAMRSGGGLEVSGRPRAAAGPRSAAALGVGRSHDGEPSREDDAGQTERAGHMTPGGGMGRRSVPGQ